jgi:hypothetical protein
MKKEWRREGKTSVDLRRRRAFNHVRGGIPHPPRSSCIAVVVDVDWRRFLVLDGAVVVGLRAARAS